MATSALYDAWNVADHAARLADEARSAHESGNVDEAISWLEKALEQIERAPYRITDAIDLLKRAQP